MTQIITTMAMCVLTIALTGMYGYSSLFRQERELNRRQDAALLEPSRNQESRLVPERMLKLEDRLIPMGQLEFESTDSLCKLEQVYQGTQFEREIRVVRTSRRNFSY